jgi:hydroxylamine oxidation protein HaoB
MDEASYHTLLARLLPFTSQPSPLDLTSPRLIYQQGGYWVYQLTEPTTAPEKTEDGFNPTQ